VATFQGFKCDSCGDVIDNGERTKRTVKLEGSRLAPQGQYSQDLCPTCVAVPDGVDLKPLRKRRTKAEMRADAANEAALSH
jgi:predicted RNA-binding Zn-ribbon protein involved in translation (DUF1610 family)